MGQISKLMHCGSKLSAKLTLMSNTCVTISLDCIRQHTKWKLKPLCDAPSSWVGLPGVPCPVGGSETGVFCTDPMGSSLLLAFTDPDLPRERLNSRVLLFPKAYAPQAGYTNPNQFDWCCGERRKSVYVQLVKNGRDYTKQLTAY